MCVRERKTVNDKGVSSEEEAYSEEKAQESNRKRAESQAPHYINGGWSGWRERGWVDRLMFAWRLRRWGHPQACAVSVAGLLKRGWAQTATNYHSRTVNGAAITKNM